MHLADITKYIRLSVLFSGAFLLCFNAFSADFTQKTGSHEPDNKWHTLYETSEFRQTHDYGQTIAFSKRLAEAFQVIEYRSLGKSHQGREIPLLILNSKGHFTPEQVRAAGQVVLLVQACIHPGEPAGKDAGLMLLRDMALQSLSGGIPSEIVVLFIPILNVDGYARFGPFNRINQNGPEQMGWRTNARNLNLNRDYLKADSDEMTHLLRFWNQWEPDFFIDTHSTNGGDYQYVMTYMLETPRENDGELSRWAEDVFLPTWKDHLESHGYPVFEYVTYRRWHDPRSGLYSGISPPALSTGYAAQRNRTGLLLETHMLKPYQQRVSSTYETLRFSLNFLAKNQNIVRDLNRTADSLTAANSFRDNPFTLSWKNTHDSIMVEFRGVDYQIKKSSLSGGDWFIYDAETPRTYLLPWYRDQIPAYQVNLPAAYLIPAEWEDVIERLDNHGIKFLRLKKDIHLEAETYRLENARLSSTVSEGRQTAAFNARPILHERIFPAGSALIPMNQPLARLIAHALEPMAISSFAYWGMFNGIFQQTEYFESYVMEKMAREMLENDQDLPAQFRQALLEDTTMASQPRQILNWFYRQTPYKDQHYLVYPVARLSDEKLKKVYIEAAN